MTLYIRHKPCTHVQTAATVQYMRLCQASVTRGSVVKLVDQVCSVLVRVIIAATEGLLFAIHTAQSPNLR